MALVGIMGMPITAARALTVEAADAACRAWQAAQAPSQVRAPSIEDVEAMIAWHEEHERKGYLQ